LHLTADNGNIGSSNQSLNTNTTKLFADTLGSVHVNEFDDLVMGNSSAGGSFSVVAGGAVTVNNVLTQNGSILVSAGAGTLTVGGQSVIFANEGNLHLQNRNTTSGAIVIGKDSILGANSASDTSLGNVFITIGDIPSSPTAGTAPAKVTVINANGGQAYFDTSGITAQGAQSTVNVNDRTVLFETGGLGAGSIKLKGDVNITAGSPLEPIAFSRSSNSYKPVTEAPLQYSTLLWTLNKDTEITESSIGCFDLINGEVLFAPSSTCRLFVGEFEFICAKGVICTVRHDGHTTVLRNLHEDNSNSIIANTPNGSSLSLGIGKELILSNSLPNIKKSIAQENIGLRNTCIIPVTSEIKAIIAEFSIISLMNKSQLITKIFREKSPVEAKLRAKLVKTAACLMSVHMGKTAFTQNIEYKD
jgi:hypothetical protein